MVYLLVQIDYEPIDPVVVFEMCICLHKLFGQIKCSDYIKSTVTNILPDLNEFGSQHIDDLSQCS